MTMRQLRIGEEHEGKCHIVFVDDPRPLAVVSWNMFDDRAADLRAWLGDWIERHNEAADREAG